MESTGPPHVGIWFFQSAHSGPSGVSGIGHRWSPLWGPGSPDHIRLGPLRGGFVWRASGPPVAGVHFLLVLQWTSRGGREEAGHEARSE